MTLRRAASRLAARAGVRQVEVSLRADSAADAADRAVLRVWRAVLRAGRAPGGWGAVMGLLGDVERALPRVVAHETAAELRRVAGWAHRTARATMRALPVGVLRRAAGRRLFLREDADLVFDDLLGPLRTAVDSAPETDLLALLFPAPTQARVDQIVYATGWEARLAAGSRLGPPGQLAGVIAQGLVAGEDQKTIARRLEPLVQGVRASARRVARTEALRVSAAVQMDCHHALGDLVVGYQVHATLDQNTRPEHAARSGTVYYKDPGPGQPGYDQMPHPPQEADGSTAWNCRCWLSPVLSDPGEVPGFVAPEPPDPLVYQDWFQRADERRRRVAVGTRRYSLVRGRSKDPGWEEFLDPETGGLLTLRQLQDETEGARAERLARVRGQLAHRRLLADRVSRRGHVGEPG